MNKQVKNAFWVFGVALAGYLLWKSFKKNDEK